MLVKGLSGGIEVLELTVDLALTLILPLIHLQWLQTLLLGAKAAF